MSIDIETRAKHREQVALLTRKGYTAPQIAESLGISTRTVQRHRRTTGVAAEASVPFTEDELERARELLDDGVSYAEVGRTLGRSPTWLPVHLPGYAWTRQQSGAYVQTLRRLKRITSRSPHAALNVTNRRAQSC